MIFHPRSELIRFCSQLSWTGLWKSLVSMRSLVKAQGRSGGAEVQAGVDTSLKILKFTLPETNIALENK